MQLVNNKIYYGNRSTPFPDIINEKLLKYSVSLIKVISKFNTGPWGFDFLQDRNNNLYAVDPNIGRFNGGHQILTFLNYHAPGKCFLKSKIGRFDHETIYEILRSEDLIFDFNTKRGVLLLNPSLVDYYNMFAVIGNDDEDVDTILKKFREAMK